jgi:putative IMPACT (imprinted ancient) family translation regulator
MNHLAINDILEIQYQFSESIVVCYLFPLRDMESCETTQ